MKTLFIYACLITCLTVSARPRKADPTLITSCTVCDSAQVIDWGDGTYRSVIELGGAGYAPSAPIRITWSDSNGPLWSFDCLTEADGRFAEIWTDVPPGHYTVEAGNPRNSKVLASVDVEVL